MEHATGADGPAAVGDVRTASPSGCGPSATVDAAYDELFACHRLPMVRLARLLVDDVASAEDVVQDAFLALYRRRVALTDSDKAVAYVRSAVINRSRSVIRRRAVARRLARADDAARGPGADEPVLLADEHRAVLAAVQTLSRRQREILVLRYWENLADADIARLLGVAEVTVRSTASRAAATVGRLLAASDSDVVSDRPGGDRSA